MTFPAGGPIGDDVFGRLFGGASGPSGPKKEEKGVQWLARVIDGKYYVPLSQVADLLKENSVLPKVRAGIERRVEKGPPRDAEA